MNPASAVKDAEELVTVVEAGVVDVVVVVDARKSDEVAVVASSADGESKSVTSEAGFDVGVKVVDALELVLVASFVVVIISIVARGSVGSLDGVSAAETARVIDSQLVEAAVAPVAVVVVVVVVVAVVVASNVIVGFV